jgi:predicted alpha/beta superfamily hydrolase
MLFVALALGAGARGIEAQAQPRPATARDSVLPHDSLAVESLELGEMRRINVYVPRDYASSRTTRYPVLYMPDGGIDEDFPHVVRTVDSLIALHAIRPVIVAGIPNTERRRDLTGPTRVASDSAIARRVGGAAVFRKFLRDEVIPTIQARYRTTKERAIIGESLAGLFILETFFVEPPLFDHYIALDPSVWWNKGALVDSAPARLRRFRATPRSLYLATSDVADIANGTVRVAEILKATPPRELTLTYVARPDLTHGTIFRAVKAGALVTVFGIRKQCDQAVGVARAGDTITDSHCAMSVRRFNSASTRTHQDRHD